MIKLSINNSKEVAIKNSKWSNPGAKLYDKLLDAFYYEDLDNDDVNKIVNNPNNLQWPNYLKEAYLIAPIKKIKNSPYGRTPYSRSGCKYPHHVVKGDQLILDVNGVRAAYIRARQMGILHGDVETHIMSHIKELELEENLHITDFIKIEENFQFVESFIETFGDEIFTEASHGNLNNSFRLGVNIKNGHRIKVIFDLNKDDVTQIGSKQWNSDGTLEDRRIIEPKERKKVISGIKKTGHNDFMSRATVLAIVDMDTNSKLKTVEMVGAMNSFLMNSTVMIGEDIIRKWKSYFDRVPKPPFYVKFWQNTMELRELITSSFGWTRQLPKNDIKKFTVGDKEDIDGSFKSTKMTKDVWEFMNNVVNQTRTHNTRARGVKKESYNISEIFDKEYLNEASHGSLKSSFRYGINIKTGHKIKIVFDLKNADTKFIGHDFGNGVSTIITDKKIVNNINKTGNNNFVSQSVVKAIIDEDTGIKLQSVKMIGLLNKYLSHIKAIVNDYDHIWDLAKTEKIFEAFQMNSLKMREAIVKLPSWKPPANIINEYRVGEKEDNPSYKSTRAVNKILDFVDNMNSEHRIPNFNSRGVIKGKKELVIKFKKLNNEVRSMLNSINKINNKDDREIANNLYTEFANMLKSTINDLKNDDNMEAMGKYSELADLKNDIKKIINKYKSESSQDNLINENFTFIESFIYSTQSIQEDEFMNEEYVFSQDNLEIDLSKFQNILNMLNGVYYGMYNKKLNKVLYSETKENEINLFDYLDKYGDSEFIIMKPDDVIKYKAGTCWDTSLFIYSKLIENGFNPQMIFYVIESNGSIITHSTVVVKSNNGIYYNIEYSKFSSRGVNKINKISDVYPNNEKLLYVNNDINIKNLLSMNEIRIEDFIKITGWNPTKYIKEKAEPPEVESIDDTEVIDNKESNEIEDDAKNEPKEEVKEKSLPKQTDAKESNKNGVKRKQLYISFIEYAKSIHSNNLFGSVFDKDAFTLYSFVPKEMRYFYRLANPLLCVLDNSLTFFALSELKKINVDNKNIDKMLIFAADNNKKLIVFNVADKKIYESTHSNNEIKIVTELAESFDEYIESLVGIKILNESFIFDI